MPVQFVNRTITVSEHIRPRLPQEHRIGIDTRMYSCSPASPVDRNRVALEQVGEEESYSPEVDDNNHRPYCIHHSTIGKDPGVVIQLCSSWQ